MPLVTPKTLSEQSLIATDLSHAFDLLPVLRNIRIVVAPKELVAVVGPSGCGKSTLLRILAGHILPDKGAVSLSGRPVVRPGRDCLLVTQTDGLLPHRTVTDNLLFPFEVNTLRAMSAFDRRLTEFLLLLPGLRNRLRRSLAGGEMFDKANAMLAQFGLADFSSAFPYQLSAGMRKRLELLRALLVSPHFLLLDEPFAHIDPLTKEPLNRELHLLVDRTSAGVLFVTHDWLEAVTLSDKVIVLAGRPAEIIAEFQVPAIPKLQRDPTDPLLLTVARQIRETLLAYNHLSPA